MFDAILRFVGEHAEWFAEMAIVAALFFLLRFFVWEIRIRAVAKKREKEGRGPVNMKALKRLLDYNKAKRAAKMRARMQERLKFWAQKRK